MTNPDTGRQHGNVCTRGDNHRLSLRRSTREALQQGIPFRRVEGAAFNRATELEERGPLCVPRERLGAQGTELPPDTLQACGMQQRVS